MAVITPTITTDDPHVYRDQMELIASYAEGVHIDFSDGDFAPTKLMHPEEAWRHDDLVTHTHVMCREPLKILEDVISLETDLVILHAEAEGLKECFERLADNGTRAGIALLPETSVNDLKELEIDEYIEHVLVFGGNLGYQGGEADLDQLAKVAELRDKYDDIEIGWDGGVNNTNIKQIVDAGVDVVNIGGYLKNAEDPKAAYKILQDLI